jgi:hypothetical protein
MKRWLCRWFGWGCPKPTPSVRPVVGVVCHRLIDEDVAALRAMGVRHVRLSLYPDGDGSQWIDRALSEGFDVLVVSYRAPLDHAVDVGRWPTVAWQIGNEPDYNTLSAAQVAIASRAGQVSPGLAHGTPLAWITQYNAAKPPAQTLALHVYGDDLADAVRGMPTVPCWYTELGHVNAAQLDAGLRAIDGNRVARAYVYALWSEADGYTLSPAHRQVIRHFIQGT